MTSKNLELALVLHLQDKATKEAGKALTDVQVGMRKLAEEGQSSAAKIGEVTYELQRVAKVSRWVGDAPASNGLRGWLIDATRESQSFSSSLNQALASSRMLNLAPTSQSSAIAAAQSANHATAQSAAPAKEATLAKEAPADTPAQAAPAPPAQEAPAPPPAQAPTSHASQAEDNAAAQQRRLAQATDASSRAMRNASAQVRRLARESTTAATPALRAQASAQLEVARRALESARAQRDAAQAAEVANANLRNAPVPQGFGDWLRQAAANSRVLRASLAAVRAIGPVAAGLQAAKSVAAPALSTSMNYGMSLARMANTAYVGKSKAERVAGMQSIDAAVMAAVRAGGGTREAVLDAATKMAGKGNLGNIDDVFKLLPLVTKTATAGDANPHEIGELAGIAVKSGGIAVADVDKALGMALYGGQVGGFELKDMSKWLPKQISLGNNAGLTGLDGFAKIVALNEMAINSAGSADAAGNNVSSFLNELNSSTTANQLKKFSYDKKNNTLVPVDGKSKNKGHVDLGNILAKNAEKGVGAIDAMLGIVNMIAQGDPKFREAQKKLAEAKKRGDKGDQEAAMKAAHQILMARNVGAIFQNQESLLGGIGAIMNPEEFRSLTKDIRSKAGSEPINNNYDLIQEQPGFKMAQKKEEEANALHRGLAGSSVALGNYAGAMTDLYRKHPGFATAIETATLALTALAAAGAGAAAMSFITGGAGAAGAAGAGASARIAAMLAGASKVGAWGAAAAGSGIASYSLATALGADKLGSWAGSSLYDLTHKDELAEQAASMRTPLLKRGQQAPDLANTIAPLPQPAALDLKSAMADALAAQKNQPTVIQLNIDGRQVAEIVNDHNTRFAQRH